MEYYSIGYITNPKMPDVTQDDVSKLTHINLAFGLIKDGLLDTHQLTNIGCIEQFRRWNPAVKIVLSVGGWGAGGFSTMAMTDAGRRAFAASCLDYVNAHGLDGIDIDWEYPCSDSAGIDADPRDRENYTALLQALRDALGQNRIVSLAAGAGDYFVRDTEMDKVPNVNNGLLQPAGSVGEYGPEYKDLTEEFRRAGNFTEYWDADAEASYLWNGSDFISFESPEAVRRKCVYTKEKGLLGVMYWEHAADTTRELLGVIASVMQDKS